MHNLIYAVLPNTGNIASQVADTLSRHPMNVGTYRIGGCWNNEISIGHGIKPTNVVTAKSLAHDGRLYKKLPAAIIVNDTWLDASYDDEVWRSVVKAILNVHPTHRVVAVDVHS